jgi:hypothetical protein
MSAARRKKRRQTLSNVLAYKNRDVIDRFCAAWFVSRDEANLLFDDLKRYLWLHHELQARGHTIHVPPVPIVDEMWHTFLMFTVEYDRWTRRAFGSYAHHVPTTERDKKRLDRQVRAAPKRARALAERERARTMSLVYDVLGERVLIRWFVTYPHRYDWRFFDRRRRPVDLPRRVAPLRRLGAALERRARMIA